MTTLVIEPIRSLTHFESLEDDWRKLERQVPRVPFFTFDWTHAWWQRLHADSLGVRDNICVYAFRTTQGQLVGIAPMMMTVRPGFGPLRIRQLQFFGADPNITEIRGVVAAPENVGAVLAALIRHLRDTQSTWDFVQLAGIPSEIQDTIDLSGFGSASWVNQLPNYYLPLAPTWNEFKGRLSRNIKESVRKCYNAPKRDGIALEWVVIRKNSDIREAVGHFLRLHEIRSALENTIRHPNVFASQLSRDFLIDVCERFEKRDALRIFQLKLNGEVVGTRIGFVCEDTLYLYFSGYDPTLAKYSIMTRVVAEAIQHAIGEGLSTVNMSTGTDISKLRWSPQEVRYGEACLISNSRRSAITYDMYALLRRGLRTAFQRANISTPLSRQV